MKFLKILLGLFLMIVGVLNAQNAPTLYNIPEYKQICFNNSLISTKQPVFLISYNNGPYNAIQVEINDKADFTGTAVTQNFTGTYSAGVKVHIAFTNDFSPVAGTTYYVRIKISTNGGSSWGNWTSQNHSFTYKDEGLTEWQQTTQKQFQEASISAALEAKADGSVSFASFTPANPFTNPSFETGAGWNVIRSGNWYSAGLSTGDGVGSMPTNGDKCINLYPSNPGSYGYFSGDYVGVTQQVDLTGLKQFTVDIAAWHSVPRFLTQDNHTHMQLRVIIGNAGTINDKSGTTLSPTFNCLATGGNTASWSKQTFDVSAYQGIYVVKIISFVIYATSGTNDEDNFYLDNIYSATEAPIAGTLSSPAVYLNSFYNASGWDKLKWSQTLNSGNIVLKIQKNNGGSWEDIAGYDNISAAGNGLQEFDISALGQESQLRLFATLTNASTPPVLYDWSLSAKIDCYAPILNVVADKAAACKGETIMLASNPDGGDLCNGNWLYSWFDGNKYWNGAAFAADEAIADVSYQDITITNFTASTTYKATVSCSLLSDCKAEKAVSVTLLDPPSIKQQPAALTLCPGEK
nr:hypothetical protein [Bacteroidales bacterium]